MKLKDIKPAFQCLTKHFIECTGAEEYDINYGNCFTWAVLAHDILPESTIVSGNGHCFLKYNGKYYDSDLPQGGSIANIFKKYYEGETSLHTNAFFNTADSLEHWRSEGASHGLRNWKDNGLMNGILRDTLNDLRFNLNVSV